MMRHRMLVLLCLFALLPQPAYAQGLVIPEGTELQLTLQEPLSSKLSEPGDEVIATLRRDVVADGVTLLRRGTEFIGRVTQAKPAKRPFKGGQLHITFEKVRLDGQEQKITAVIKSASDFSRDEKVKSDSEGTLKGGADGGQVLRNVGMAAGIGMIGATIIILASAQDRGLAGFGGLGGISQGGAIAGASVIGGSVVAGMLLSKGKEVRLDQSSIIRMKLERPIVID